MESVAEDAGEVLMDATYILCDVAEAFFHADLKAVMIGNAAAAIQGAPVTTMDIDFCIEDNEDQDSSRTANINTRIFNVKRSTLSMPSSSQYDCRHFLYGQSCTNP